MSEGAIAVSGLSVVQTLAPGLPVIQSLRDEPEFKRPIVGLSHDPLDPPNYDTALVDASCLIPYPMYGSARLLERLMRAHSQWPLAAIVPTLDSEVPLYIALEEKLAAEGIAVLVPKAETFELRSKVRLADISRITGIQVPYTRAVYTYEAGMAFAREFQLPFVVKGHLHGATMVMSWDQFAPAISNQIASFGYPIVLQQYIPGTEFDVAALGSRTGSLIGAVPMKKLQLDGMGKAWGGITVADPELVEMAQRVVERLHWPGPLELELMRHSTTGQLYLLEINPRFPAWIHLTVSAGQNLPWALVRMLLGEDVTPFTGYHAGVMSLRRSIDITCSLGVYEALVMNGEVDHHHLDPDLIRPQWVSSKAAR